MKTLFIFLPIRDYIKTRRKLWRQYLIPLATGIIVLIGAFAIDVRDGVDIEAIFSDFVGIQISGIATLVSFLLAIITILVSSDNENIRKLKSEKSSEIHYKKLDNEQFSLFQVLLSNISYYVMVEIIYMMILYAASSSLSVLWKSVASAIAIWFLEKGLTCNSEVVGTSTEISRASESMSPVNVRVSSFAKLDIEPATTIVNAKPMPNNPFKFFFIIKTSIFKLS